MTQRLVHLRVEPVGKARLRVFPGQPLQRLLRRLAPAEHFVRILIGQLIQREGNGFRKIHRRRNRVRPGRKQPRHLFRRFQMPLRIGGQQRACVFHPHMLADRRHHILQGPPLWGVVVHVIARHQPQAQPFGKGCKPRQPRPVIRAIEKARRQIGDVQKRHRLPQPRLEGRIHLSRRHGHQHLPVLRAGNIRKAQMALPLRRAPVAQGQEFRQPSIGRPVAREAQKLEPVLRHEPRPHHQLDARFLRRHMCPHDPRQRVAVGNPHRLMAQSGGLVHQLVRMAAAAQKTEIAGDPQLRKARHAASPVTGAATASRPARLDLLRSTGENCGVLLRKDEQVSTPRAREHRPAHSAPRAPPPWRMPPGIAGDTNNRSGSGSGPP